MLLFLRAYYAQNMLKVRFDVFIPSLLSVLLFMLSSDRECDGRYAIREFRLFYF